jgi:segregation and condensation protein B
MKENRKNKRIIRLEAALYASGRPLNIRELRKVIRTRSDDVIYEIIKALDNKYKKRGSAFEVKTLNKSRVKLQLRPNFEKILEKIGSRPLLSLGPLKTLSYIAYHQPVEQTKVVNERGRHVYSHIQQIEKLGLIKRTPLDNGSFILETTPFFSDYFGFTHNPAKTRIQLQQIFNQLKIKELENDEHKGESLDSLAYPWNRLTHRFSEYPSPTNQGSQ